jgi:hypothetical protein
MHYIVTQIDILLAFFASTNKYFQRNDFLLRPCVFHFLLYEILSSV